MPSIERVIIEKEYQQYREKYLNARELNLESPVDISLELSSFCNMACSYCYHSDKKNMPFKQNLMQPETFKKVVREAADLGVHSLKFNWRGESTMNPWFGLMTKFAKDLAKGSTFIDRITNSNFKFDSTREDIFVGLCNQTKVKVSYDSFDKSVFENQRRLGNHDVTTANIDKFYNWPGRDNKIVIQAVRTSSNKDEDLEGLAKKRWPDAEISIRDMVEGRVDKDLTDIKHKERDFTERQSCIQAHARLIFSWNGFAVMCCPDIKEELRLGNIKDMTVSEIFNSPKAKEMRASLLNGSAFNKSPCQSCSSFETFKGFKPQWDS